MSLHLSNLETLEVRREYVGYESALEVSNLETLEVRREYVGYESALEVSNLEILEVRREKLCLLSEKNSVYCLRKTVSIV